MRKDQILNASVELMAAEGIHAPSTRRIAAVAGTSEALIFRHFTDRKGLETAVTDLVCATVAGAFREVAQLHPSSPIVDGFREAVASSADAWRVYFQLRTIRNLHQGYDFMSYDERIHSILALWLKKQGVKKPERDAVLLRAQLEGIVMSWLRNPDAFPFKKALEQAEAGYP